MWLFSGSFVKRNDKVFTAVTPCQPLHWSHFSDQEPRTLRNSRANTECLFLSRGLNDLRQVVGNGIVSAHWRTQTLSSYFPTVRTLLFWGWQLYTFSPLLRSFFRLMEKAFQHTAKNHALLSFPTPTHPREAITAAPQKGCWHLLPTHPSQHHENIKGAGKENKKPGHLGSGWNSLSGVKDRGAWVVLEFLGQLLIRHVWEYWWINSGQNTWCVSSFSIFAMSPRYTKSAWQLPLQQTEPEGTISSPFAQSSHTGGFMG